MNDPNKQKKKEEMEKLEAERLRKLEAAKKEIDEAKNNPPHPKRQSDEQESDGSANAFENK